MTRAAAKRLRRALRRPFEWLGIGLGLALFVPLPRRALFAVADFISAVFWLCDRKGRRHAEANLAVLFAARPLSGRRRRLVIRRSYRNMARSVAYAFWTFRHARARAAATGEMDARAKAFLAANRPAVTVSAHLGCWEILSQLALLEGHAMMSVAKDVGSPAMTRLLMRARRSVGQEIVSARGAFRPLLAGIRAGKSLGLLVDQAVRPADGGQWVRFCGRPHPVSAAPAFFAAKAKAPILVAWARPLKGARYRCEFVAAHSAEEARDVWGATQAVLADLERVIRRHPSAWALNYNCFRKHPTAAELAQLEKREAEAR